MNRTAVKNYAVRARRDFQKIVTEQANALGISGKEIAKAEPAGDMLVIKGRPFPRAIDMPRRELVNRVQRDGFDVVIENVAYTLFNRFCALRFMEVNGYLPFRVFSSSTGDDTPDILKHAIEAADAFGVTGDKREQITDLKLRGDQDQKLYSMLLLAQCNAFSKAMPFLFERPNDVTEMLMPGNLLQSDSVVRELVASIDETDWREIEIVGWLYQFYISEKKDQVIGKVVKKEDIPAATQLFTPKWIVQYMVENSLGRLWLQSHPDSALKSRMPYYIENPDDAKLSPDEILTVDTPDEIKCMDPCCGSGHILVYMFDLLYAMYEETGYIQRDIPRMILENNLHGIDIDQRAAQLSGFALMMKARERDQKYLDSAVQPHVIAIEESNGIDLQAEARIEGKEQRSPFDTADALFSDERLLPAQRTTPTAGGDELNAFAPLVQFFLDAKNYGSLLRIPESLAKMLVDLETRLVKQQGESALFAGAALSCLARLLRQAKMLAGKYHIVSTNPPYVGGKGMNSELKTFAEKFYSSTKSNLFSMFMERISELGLNLSYSGMMTPFVWMYISNHEELRDKVLSKSNIITLVQLDYDSYTDAKAHPCAFVLRKQNIRGSGCYIFLEGFKGSELQPIKCLEAIQDTDCSWRYDRPNDFFNNIPGKPLAFWAPDALVEVFGNTQSLGVYADCVKGLDTCDNERFVRKWHEVSILNLGLSVLNTDQSNTSTCWYPYDKGGFFRKWYGNKDHVVNWQFDGLILRNLRDDSGKIKSRPQNTRYYFTKGISFGAITSADFSARFMESSIFGGGGNGIFIDSPYHALGVLNSKIVGLCTKILNPTANILVGDLLRIPYIKDFEGSNSLASDVKKLINIHQIDWNSYETSWGFACLPLLVPEHSQPALKSSYKRLCVHWQTLAEETKRIEEHNNRIFIEAYGLQDELTPDVPIKEITLTCNPVYRYGTGKAENEYEGLQLTDTMKELISYAVGCMMGRYSPDTPGLQFAGGTYNHEKACAAAPSFHPDADGILPVLAEAYFEDDLTARFTEFLKATFGKEHLSENLRFVAEAIGIKGSESPQDAIRRFLANDFFKYHMRMYKKRPIYWLFSSGKEKAFQALVYLHRYTPSTLARMRTGYLHELQNKLRARIEDMEAGKDAATSTAQANRINRELTKLRKQLEELRVFDEKLHHYADQRIELDLDDGVKHNYGLFGDLLAEVKDVTGDKE